MNNYLAIDFGTTRIKAAIVDVDSGRFSHVNSFIHLPNCARNPAYQEVSVDAIKKQFEQICRTYDQISHISGIVVCSQMGGYVVVDRNNQPLSEYISWKDERSLQKIDGISSCEILERLGIVFRNTTGMKLRSSFPVASLLHMARSGQVQQQCKVISIPELICTIHGGCANVVHPTMIANFGVYDIYRRQIAKDIVQIIEEYAPGTIHFNEIADENTRAGYWESPEHKKIPIYVGVGDHQCTVLGAGNISATSLSVNIGTGSQVAAIDTESDWNIVEQRPYFSGSMLSAITHIPAGRVLEEHIMFLADVAATAELGPNYFWERLAAISPEAIAGAQLEFDLALFQSAWGYRQGGYIKNISEGTLTLDAYLAGLLKSWCKQYQRAADYIDPDKKIRTCILSGSIPRRLANTKPIFSSLLQRRVGWTEAVEEEPLLGLRLLAVMADGRARDYKQAAAYVRSHFLVRGSCAKRMNP